MIPELKSEFRNFDFENRTMPTKHILPSRLVFMPVGKGGTERNVEGANHLLLIDLKDGKTL